MAASYWMNRGGRIRRDKVYLVDPETKTIYRFTRGTSHGGFDTVGHALRRKTMLNCAPIYGRDIHRFKKPLAWCFENVNISAGQV